MANFTPSQLASANSGYWADLYKIRLQVGMFSFLNHEYQREWFSDSPRRRCIRKATQCGATECEVLDSLHGMIYKALPMGCLYLFPDTDSVDDFSKSRFAPLIQANRLTIGKYVKSGGKGTDTAGLKKIHDAFLYLRSARLSQRIDDVSESVKLKSAPVDRVVFDEVDHMSSDAIGKALGRMGHSLVKQERYLSNPIVPGEGIDKLFALSDQKYWFRRCNTCEKWTCAELFFMEDPERCVGTRADGSGYIACRNCGREVRIQDGSWEAQAASNSNYMSGYHWSQLTSIYNDPLEILSEFRYPPNKNLADVYRLRLGLPYISAEDRLTEQQVLACCGNEQMYSRHAGPCAMGVDVGKTKHIIIGQRLNNSRYRIIKVARLSSWFEIHDLARRFGVKSAVVDIRPYQDAAKEFQKAAKYPVFLCEYSDNPAYLRTWDTKSKIVKDYRTGLFDETHRVISEPGLLSIPRYDDEIKKFAKQMANPYKILEVNKRTGARQYRYKGTDDHYRNALNYFLLAASKSRIAGSQKPKNRQTNAGIR